MRRMQPQAGKESNVGFEGAEPSVKARFKALWKDATDISEECLKQAENAWCHRQKAIRLQVGLLTGLIA